MQCVELISRAPELHGSPTVTSSKKPERSEACQFRKQILTRGAQSLRCAERSSARCTGAAHRYGSVYKAHLLGRYNEASSNRCHANDPKVLRSVLRSVLRTLSHTRQRQVDEAFCVFHEVRCLRTSEANARARDAIAVLSVALPASTCDRWSVHGGRPTLLPRSQTCILPISAPSTQAWMHDSQAPRGGYTSRELVAVRALGIAPLGQQAGLNKKLDNAASRVSDTRR